MTYTITLFDHKGDYGLTESFLRNKICAFLRSKGVQARLLAAEVGLSMSEYWLVRESETVCEPPALREHLHGLSGDGQLYEEFCSNVLNVQEFLLFDLESNVPWFREAEKLYHLEKFNSVIKPDEFQEFMVKQGLPYWREREFHAKLFKNSQGESAYLLMTQMDKLSSIESWPEMAAGEAKGRAIMQWLVASMDYPRASIVRDITI